MSEQRPQVETDVQDSNPNAAGPQRLEGDMGISSERTGPDATAPADTGIQGTGSHGTAAHSTDGVSDTSRGEAEVDQPDDPPGGSGPSRATGIDRTVGEANTAEVPAHDFDPASNPGHSHG